MSKNWSSFENDRLIMESWRKHLAEEPEKVEEAWPGFGKKRGWEAEMEKQAKEAGEEPAETPQKGPPECCPCPKGQEEYPATEYSTLFKTLDDINNKLGDQKVNRGALNKELQALLTAQNFNIQEGLIREQEGVSLARYPNFDIDPETYPELAKFIQIAGPKYAAALKNVFQRSGFKGPDGSDLAPTHFGAPAEKETPAAETPAAETPASGATDAPTDGARVDTGGVDPHAAKKKPNVLAVALAAAASDGATELVNVGLEELMGLFPPGSWIEKGIEATGVDPTKKVAEFLTKPLQGLLTNLISGIEVIENMDAAAQVILGKEQAQRIVDLATKDPPAAKEAIKKLPKLDLIKGLAKAGDQGLLGPAVDANLKKIGALPVVGPTTLNWLLDKTPPPEPATPATTPEAAAPQATPATPAATAAQSATQKRTAELKAQLARGTTRREHMIYERWQKIAGINKKAS